MALKATIDFRGGYATDIPSELMNDNELVKAENCTWKNGVTKRNGITTYDTTDHSTMVGYKGAIRAYINSTWYTIVAVDDDSYVTFYYMSGTGTTLTAIDATFHFTKGYNVEFAELNGHVVAVNGVDKPAVIYWSSALVIENLEAYDERTRDYVNWFAGQWDDDGSPTTFIDDTDDAQDAGTADFQLGDTTNNDGFYIACDYTFNKVVFTGGSQAGGAPVAEYMYWNGSAWTTLGTLVTTPDWTAAGADRTLEFNLPLDTDGSLLWDVYGVDDTEDTVVNKFMIRVRFTTAASGAFTCGALALSNTQYLTQILQDERPHLVRAHNSQIYLASGNIVNFSPPYYVTGWREGQAEHFDDGGAKVTDMISFADTLVVGKENTIYTWLTTDLMDPVRSKPLTTVGPICARSMRQIGNLVAFVARDGIYTWNGEAVSKVSKHIQTDIDSWTLTNAAATVWKNEYWVSFPTNSIVLAFDPDTFRNDDMGDGKVSFYKFTSYKVSQFVPCNGSADSNYLLGIVDQTAPYVVRCDYGTQDNVAAATNIDMRLQTKYFSYGKFQNPHLYGRVKLKLKEVSAHAGERHVVTFYRDDGDAHEHVEIAVPKGTGYYTEDMRVPYTVDGDNFSLEVRHNASTLATVIGFSADVIERSY